MNPSPIDTRLSTLAEIPFKALNATIPLPSLRPERRNISARTALLVRVRSEFDEMPGTALTLAQATRLFGLSIEICARVLTGLVTEGRLQQSRDGRYRRGSEAA